LKREDDAIGIRHNNLQSIRLVKLLGQGIFKKLRGTRILRGPRKLINGDFRQHCDNAKCRGISPHRGWKLRFRQPPASFTASRTARFKGTHSVMTAPNRTLLFLQIPTPVDCRVRRRDPTAPFAHTA
jgi:hypothetical protein